jgi:hypothetical protein
MNYNLKTNRQMKRKTILKFIAFLLILGGGIFSCGKIEENSTGKPKNEEINLTENLSFIGDSVYYVVGYNASAGVNSHNGIAKSGGYLFISENLKDTLYASNLNIIEEKYYEMGDMLDNLFAFPLEIIHSGICGYNFFPQEYRFVYKVQIACRLMTKEEKLHAHPACNTLYAVPYPYLQPKCVVITSISKI